MNAGPELFSRRSLLGAALAALPLTASGAQAVAQAGAGGPALPVPEREVRAGPMLMALTFDDGPSPLYTPRVLAVLARYRVPATFFLLGLNAAKYPDVVRRIADAGHTLGNHTWNHPSLSGLPPAATHDQITRTQQTVTAVCGRTPALFRAPGGHFAPAALAACADLELRPVSWSLSSVDSGTRTAQRIGRAVLEQARTGAIVLHHDGVLSGSDVPEHEGAADRSPTVQALAHYLPRLLYAGYRFTTPGAHRAP
ncbi:polysaccharide deacetylase family protein [Streptomyces sp. NPDC048442]|uniref:polysaccharide deacetylase family protein n=1 Tax=Streptomyces sp. NPDC048442 TaxID=3154823 RepID=UPI003426F117